MSINTSIARLCPVPAVRTRRVQRPAWLRRPGVRRLYRTAGWPVSREIEGGGKVIPEASRPVGLDA